MYDFIIIGGGIVGLSTAMHLSNKYPERKIILLEKEASWAVHQTGNNSGVIHSGIYYKPGSYKAKFCREGNNALVEFCQQHDIPYEICGKVIVATEAEEIPRLENIYQRGIANGLDVSLLSREQAKEIEPHVNTAKAILVKSTGIVDYKQVAQKYAELATKQGVVLQNNCRVVDIKATASGYTLITNKEEYQTRYLINCAGLFSDRVARLAGVQPPVKIVPFRGEYYELIPEKRYLASNTLIYPVPNPDFPFLGVHFTKMIDGSVHAGPNAVLSFKREGYYKTDFNLKDFLETMTYSGFWKLTAKHGADGFQEMARSWSKALFVASLQRLIPEVKAEDVVPTHAGVRAQALKNDGKLVDDFLIIDRPQAMHVCNAPSPAATSSLAIGKAIAQRVTTQSRI